MMDLPTLQYLCTLLMCDDPTNLTQEGRQRLEQWANNQAQSLGFTDWVDAYHADLTQDPQS